MFTHMYVPLILVCVCRGGVGGTATLRQCCTSAGDPAIKGVSENCSFVCARVYREAIQEGGEEVEEGGGAGFRVQ